MDIKDEKQALEAVNALESYLKERLTEAHYNLSAAQQEVTRWQTMVASLESRTKSITFLITQWPAYKPSIPSTPDENLRAVVSILSASGGPMRIKAIAELAFKKEMIGSTKGLSGVTSTVSNVVSRHSPRVFVNTGWGWWDLAERRRPKLVPALPKPVGEHGQAEQKPEGTDVHQAGLRESS
ncbi:MAG: hypothetical protein WA005_19140 [Candidatus Binataceae bacterium]